MTQLDPGLINALAQVRLVVFDFDGVFTDNAVYVSQDGVESVRCWRGDGIGLDRLRRHQLQLIVVSTEVNPVVSARCQKLRLPCIQGCPDKLVQLREIWATSGLGAQETCYLGNDVNDATALQSVGVPAVVADAHPEVFPLARLVTRARGGHGAVRELCDVLGAVLDGRITPGEPLVLGR